MQRSKTTRNFFERKPSKIVQISNPVLKDMIGASEQKGCWLIYGADKNGKTSCALRLAKDLQENERVWYISAEEGLEDSFKAACLRAGIGVSDKIIWDEYLSVEEIVEECKNNPRKPKIIFIDNLTMYKDELKVTGLKKSLLDRLAEKRLIVLLAHEERGEPYTAAGMLAKKLAKVIIRIKGLRAFIISRTGPGGQIDIDEEKSELFGWDKLQNNDNNDV